MKCSHLLNKRMLKILLLVLFQVFHGFVEQSKFMVKEDGLSRSALVGRANF